MKRSTAGPLLFDWEHAPLDRIARHFHPLGQDHKQQKYALGYLIGNLGIEIAGPARMPRKS
ncbi:hypothetical protein [Rhizobium sp. BK376]|uniref:hypothetical protein n=1 Tax=Rhizobium sp. BK376 TaxID=2512149 RepID=UPI0014052C82|nr:hypothetical protein [Rhizobium sp. BK376]